MDFNINHWFIWLLAGAIVLLVLAQSIFFLWRSVKRAKAIGMSGSVIKKTISGSAVFSIAPAFSIFIGVVVLIRVLGIPLPWMRLSVIGAMTYEIPAASAVLEALNFMQDGQEFRELTNITLTASQYISIVTVMTLGIMIGPILAPILVKPYKKGIVKLESKNKEWTDILMTSLFLGMIATFLGMIFVDVANPAMKGAQGWIPVFVMLISAFITAIMGILIKKLKWKWLTDYTLPISMVCSMLLAIPITNWVMG